jgi:transcription initiation factor TFIID subunit TAF12
VLPLESQVYPIRSGIESPKRGSSNRNSILNSNEKETNMNQTKSLFTNLYSKFNPFEEKESSGHKKNAFSTKSPFKNAGDYLKRKISGEDQEELNDLANAANEGHR